jgi:hypothetical protein
MEWASAHPEVIGNKELQWDFHAGREDAELTLLERREKRIVRSLGLVFASCHVGAPFFEMFEMLRKLLLTSVLQFVDPGSVTQITVAILISFAALVVSFRFSPFVDESIDTLNQAALTQVFLASFGALLLFVNTDEKNDKLYFGVLVVACQFGLPALPVIAKIISVGREGVRKSIARLCLRLMRVYIGPYVAELKATAENAWTTLWEETGLADGGDAMAGMGGDIWDAIGYTRAVAARTSEKIKEKLRKLEGNLEAPMVKMQEAVDAMESVVNSELAALGLPSLEHLRERFEQLQSAVEDLEARRDKGEAYWLNNNDLVERGDEDSSVEDEIIAAVSRLTPVKLLWRQWQICQRKMDELKTLREKMERELEAAMAPAKETIRKLEETMEKNEAKHKAMADAA